MFGWNHFDVFRIYEKISLGFDVVMCRPGEQDRNRMGRVNKFLSLPQILDVDFFNQAIRLLS